MAPNALPFTINRRRGQNQCYDELIGEGVQPLRMMLIPPGSFLMGSPEDEQERLDREGPQHEVTLTRFFLAKYPVTQAQWRAVAAMPQVKRNLKPDPSSFKGDDRPVERVSWYDAVEFCERLTNHTNRQYRLPSEAEWEYACRANTTTPFHFGETLSTDYANYNGSNEEYGAYGPGVRGEYRQETTPVGFFEVCNEYGLSDMHGNVWEWCQDDWHESYEGAPSDGSAWVEGDSEESKIIRGGSWDLDPGFCRSASRIRFDPDGEDDPLGFRVCCSSPRVLEAG